MITPLPQEHFTSQSSYENATQSRRRTSTSTELAADEGTEQNTRWTEQQTSILITSWKENFERIQRARNAEAWQRIMDDVNKASGRKSVKQCRDKLRNLKSQYFKAKQHNKKTGNSPAMWNRHYDELDEVLGTRPVIIAMPGVLQAGSLTPESTSSCSRQYDGQDSDSKDELDVALLGRKRTTERDTPAQAPSHPKRKRARQTRRRVAEDDERVSSFQQQLLDMQKRQLEMYASAERRTEELLLRLETEQRKADQEARARDQEFLLRIAELFSKK